MDATNGIKGAAGYIPYRNKITVFMRYQWDFCSIAYNHQGRLTKPGTGAEEGIQSV